jgi:UDP-N-acetylglucosamine--N-acetylmuramyl-(pentapeptide) pyrophosphoryl-undecaprenol N-acetylglucosamine transferase
VKNRKFIVAAGGSGGHIIPALSICRELAKKGVELLFVGNRNSMEEKLVKEAGIKFRSINSQKFYRSFTFKHLLFPYRLLKSISDSKKIISDFKPDAFIGTGGFVSGPVGYAAHLKKLPIFLQEQNSFPGVTTKILSKFASMIFLGNAGAAKHLRTNNIFVSGNPINTFVAEESDALDYAKYGLKSDSKKIFLFGGSQGSVILNNSFFPIIDNLLESGFEIIWQIGKYSYEKFYPKVKDKKGVYAFDFTNEMGKILNSVSLVIARAGALSLAEIETKKVPSILVPLPTAAENHQYYNALELAEKEVALILEQRYLSSTSLLAAIEQTKNNLDSMNENFSDSIHKIATVEIANQILKHFE